MEQAMREKSTEYWDFGIASNVSFPFRSSQNQKGCDAYSNSKGNKKVEFITFYCGTGGNGIKISLSWMDNDTHIDLPASMLNSIFSPLTMYVGLVRTRYSSLQRHALSRRVLSES